MLDLIMQGLGIGVGIGGAIFVGMLAIPLAVLLLYGLVLLVLMIFSDSCNAIR